MTAWISLQSKGLSRVFSRTTIQKHQFFGIQSFFLFHLSHPYMTTGKPIALTIWSFVSKVIFLPFNMLSRFVKAFLSRSKLLSFSWMWSLPAVILCFCGFFCSDFGVQENKISHSFHFSPSIFFLIYIFCFKNYF